MKLRGKCQHSKTMYMLSHRSSVCNKGALQCPGRDQNQHCTPADDGYTITQSSCAYKGYNCRGFVGGGVTVCKKGYYCV